MEPFIIENAINTCYIDSLLMGLLYKSSSINNILTNDIKNSIGIYLQEYIKERLQLLDEIDIEIVYNYVFSKYNDILLKQEVDEKQQIELGNHPRKVNKELIAN